MTRINILAISGLIVGTVSCSESPGHRNADAGSAADFKRVDLLSCDTKGGSDANFFSDTVDKDAPISLSDATPSKKDSSFADSSTTNAGLVLKVTFDNTPVGQYAEADLKSDWKWIKWNQGLKEGRVHIIDGADAFKGHALRILYPKGSVGPQEGGAQWWVTLPKSYTELYCSYRIKFQSGFDFVKGGKIPGLMGGDGNTGGNKPDGTDGWSARMMWRTGGEAVQYVYHPDQPTTYGEDMSYDIGGKHFFNPGTWHLVEHRIVINTPGQKDGIVQAWWDGKLALDRKNIRFRDVNTFAIDGFYFSTFFGGSDSSWASTKDEVVFFDDFVIATKPITH